MNSVRVDVDEVLSGATLPEIEVVNSKLIVSRVNKDFRWFSLSSSKNSLRMRSSALANFPDTDSGE